MRSLEELIDTAHSHKGRFVFITDWHARSRAPKMRKDDWHQALLAKLEWVLRTPSIIGASRTIIGGGDIFDAPTPSLEVADDIVDMFVKYNCKLATVFGNHDLDSSLSTAPRTVLGHLMRRSEGAFSVLPILSGKPFEGIAGIDIWGHHYKYDNHHDTLNVPASYHDKVVISHAMFLKEPAIYDHTLFSDMETNADLILLGHYHPQQQMTRLNNARQTLIGGPGALMRGSLSHDNLQRIPSLAVVEFGNGELQVDFIPIGAAKPAEEVFRLELAQEQNRQEQSLDSFRNDLTNLKVQGMNIAELIEEISTNEKIPDNVKEEALKRIGVK